MAGGPGSIAGRGAKVILQATQHGPPHPQKNRGKKGLDEAAVAKSW